LHPRTPFLLIDLVAVAERFIKADDAWLHPTCQPEKIAALLAEVRELAAKPSDDDRKLINDVTLWLAQSLDHIAREGKHGETKKWMLLARDFLVFVRGDLAEACGMAHLPDRGS